MTPNMYVRQKGHPKFGKNIGIYDLNTSKLIKNRIITLFSLGKAPIFLLKIGKKILTLLCFNLTFVLVSMRQTSMNPKLQPRLKPPLPRAGGRPQPLRAHVLLGRRDVSGRRQRLHRPRHWQLHGRRTLQLCFPHHNTSCLIWLMPENKRFILFHTKVGSFNAFFREAALAVAQQKGENKQKSKKHGFGFKPGQTSLSNT
jgi:hypothetical protein